MQRLLGNDRRWSWQSRARSKGKSRAKGGIFAHAAPKGPARPKEIGGVLERPRSRSGYLRRDARKLQSSADRSRPLRRVAAGVAALGDAGRLTGAATQVIELGAADGAAADDLDHVDNRRIKREDALDALAEADLADGEARADALVRAGDAHAFERLDAGAVAFDDLDADAERVAGAEFGDLSCRRSARRWLRARESRSGSFLTAFVSRRRAPEGGACDAPPWRSIRSGRLSRVSSTARSCRHAAIFA